MRTFVFFAGVGGRSGRAGRAAFGPLRRYQEEHDKGDDSETNRGNTVKLLDGIAVLADVAHHEGQANKNETDVSAENPKRGFPKGEKWLSGHQRDEMITQPIRDNGEGNQIEQAERSDLPLVEKQAERLLG